MRFPERLKELREEKKLSRSRLGKELGYSNSIVSKWERGEIQPNADSIIKLAEFFDVTSDYLLGIEK